MLIFILIFTLINPLLVLSQQPQPFEADTFQTTAGTLTITFIGHGTLMLTWGDQLIHVDPVGREADYSQLPQADLVLVTHEHGDHLDPNVLQL
ncbi:MAG: MBL fold metallo-hydrolase, partial [candidate division KSB1 bacterium]|nr:MBL fold metallo-hydrolase [candidate division KSB1 bacterium]